LDEAGHGDAARLDLAGGEPARLEDLETVIAEGEVAAAIGLALVAALHLLPVFGTRGLKHLGDLLLHGRGRGLRRARRKRPGRARRTGRPLLRDGGDAFGEHLAAEDPNLAADLPVGRLRLGEAVVDVGAQRVQGNAPFAVPLVAGHLRPAQPSRAGDADALGAELLRRLDRLLHRAAEGDAALEL